MGGGGGGVVETVVHVLHEEVDGARGCPQLLNLKWLRHSETTK